MHASTSEVYGDPTISPQSEKYWGNVNPIGERSCYNESKRAVETLLFDYYRQHKLKIKICRIFNTYGPIMHPNDGRVISNFIIQAINNKPITIYGDGMQTRSFCYISDLINGLFNFMNHCNNFTGPINLGNPEAINILDLAKKIIHITGSNSKITFNILPEDDPKQRMPDIQLAEKKIKWKPKINLNEGLLETIKYFNLN